MTQPELFENEVNPEDYHISVKANFGAEIDVWLENGNFQLIVSDELGYSIFGIEAPIDEVKMSINDEELAVVHGSFRYKAQIEPSYLDKEIKADEIDELRWHDDSASNNYYLPRKIEAYKKAGVQLFVYPFELGVIL